MTDPEFEFSTPMMQQYMALKSEYSDCLLFFRLGDFYELFLDDAKIGAQVLGITLTGRARGKDGRIPMAGVPYHAVDSYLAKLVKAGYKVALCEQVTAPTGKGLVDRQVTRIVTPGTLTDDKALTSKHHNYIISVHPAESVVGVAALDITTGEFLTGQFAITATETTDQILAYVMTHLDPAECIVAPSTFTKPEWHKKLTSYQSVVTFPYQSWSVRTKQPKKILTKYFPLATMGSLGMYAQTQALVAAAALLSYVEETQKTVSQHIQPPTLLLTGSFLRLDRSTIANLELVTTLRSDHRLDGTLLHALDHTQTAMGGRLLKQWLLQPLTDLTEINQRLDAVAYCHDQPPVTDHLTAALSPIQDIERLLARLSLGTGTPRDLIGLAQSLAHVLSIQAWLTSHSSAQSPVPNLLEIVPTSEEQELSQLVKRITTTLVELPPVDPKQGNVIKTGLHPQLDQLKTLIANSKNDIAHMEILARQDSGISSLKIKFNQVFGFYIEISKANLHLVPASYQRTQTLVNAERFTTPELKKYEDIILQAEAKMQELEYQLWQELLATVLTHTRLIQHAAQRLAQLDCLVSLAEVARRYHYTRPELTTTGTIKLTRSRHPVVERLVDQHQFVSNDVCLDHGQHQLLLITGPNMAGKSVVMRQVALITIMAHLGSFVPADHATISLTDQIFVRSGAADMITAGLSTFMVEMVETAYILRHATPNSLVIMDEIGRGTSTTDGISIAWAIAEYLLTHQQPGPKTLFATHYHELQALAELYPQQMKNYHMAITPHRDSLVFLYTLTAGNTSESYGIAVAQLAGVPPQVIATATRLVSTLAETAHLPAQPQSPGSPNVSGSISPDGSLGSADEHPIIAQLRHTTIEDLTPVNALNMLAEWKSQI